MDSQTNSQKESPTYAVFRRRFVALVVEAVMSIDDGAEEAIEYIRSRKDRSEWTGHKLYWEGVRWCAQLIRDGVRKAEAEGDLFGDQVRKVISSLARTNERHMSTIRRLEKELEQERAERQQTEMFNGKRAA